MIKMMKKFELIENCMKTRRGCINNVCPLQIDFPMFLSGNEKCENKPLTRMREASFLRNHMPIPNQIFGHDHSRPIKYLPAGKK